MSCWRCQKCGQTWCDIDFCMTCDDVPGDPVPRLSDGFVTVESIVKDIDTSEYKEGDDLTAESRRNANHKEV